MLSGNAGDDVLYGRGGNDVIMGGGGDDALLPSLNLLTEDADTDDLPPDQLVESRAGEGTEAEILAETDCDRSRGDAVVEGAPVDDVPTTTAASDDASANDDPSDPDGEPVEPTAEETSTPDQLSSIGDDTPASDATVSPDIAVETTEDAVRVCESDAQEPATPSDESSQEETAVTGEVGTWEGDAPPSEAVTGQTGETVDRSADDDSSESTESNDESVPANDHPPLSAAEAETGRNDHIFGGAGNDWLFGQDGDDWLFGDDLLSPELLRDLLMVNLTGATTLS